MSSYKQDERHRIVRLEIDRTKSGVALRVGLCVLLLIVCSTGIRADQSAGTQIHLRDPFAPHHLHELTEKLRLVSGWQDLRFDEARRLVLSEGQPFGGSKAARELLSKAIAGKELIIIEDASDRLDVVFCRVLPGKWKNPATNLPPAFVLQIDFEDFTQLTGDAPALAAFHVGWGVLHELQHVVNDTPDTRLLGEPGNCESHINAMRRELHLPERADYHFVAVPASLDTEFKTRLVRLAFVRRIKGNNQKRYWVIWDAAAVGGINAQIATVGK